MKQSLFIIGVPIAIAMLVLLIGLPARMVGKNFYEKGLREQSKWKRDLGSAIYANSFYLTFTIGILIVIVLPKLIFGKSLFDL